MTHARCLLLKNKLLPAVVSLLFIHNPSPPLPPPVPSRLSEQGQTVPHRPVILHVLGVTPLRPRRLVHAFRYLKGRLSSNAWDGRLRETDAREPSRQPECANWSEQQSRIKISKQQRYPAPSSPSFSLKALRPFLAVRRHPKRTNTDVQPVPSSLSFSHLTQESSARNITQCRGASLCCGDVSFFERHAAELLPHGRRLPKPASKPDLTRRCVVAVTAVEEGEGWQRLAGAQAMQ